MPQYVPDRRASTPPEPSASPVRRARRLKRATAAVIAALAPALALAGCGQVRVTTVSGAPEGPTIAIGVAADEPAIGAWHDGAYEGFDVTVAKYVAAKLGYANKQIVFKQVRPENRASMLDNGQVDMVVASWPVTDESRQQADFAGPYLETGVGLLVRANERATFGTGTGDAGDGIADDLADRTICTVKGDETAAIFRSSHPQATLQERESYAQCVTALQVGSADAIASDMAVLSGLRSANGPQYMAVLEDRGTVRYGIAVGKGTPQLAQKIAEALEDMVEDGSMAAAQDTLRERTGLEATLVGDPEAIVSDADSAAD
ncbi:glutamate ABC transporter substrate-binding protein [Bifidobacterium miconisargentati]|uniref:glutamate ABC transporter substrate-binding protein n=1 Tax=Bifidobacterium miconisargentati TaxID=2834437 RepID=UPI001BDC6B9B|nr:glutamate ABC transporter substrate-binding protein [Bifidobacterium miconisargentati]MBW3090700.1 glutamate ABC transporter substrate-binding protein [Bifidobacterium miconisargentati]